MLVILAVIRGAAQFKLRTLGAVLVCQCMLIQLGFSPCCWLSHANRQGLGGLRIGGLRIGAF
eukprot:15336435-Alexandrium_andersonii.AAC.1